jgi:hypothetical protein
MTEKDLWKRMYHASKGIAHVTRIENSATFGVPDVAGTYKGKSFWLEFKNLKGSYIIFQPSQIAWIIQEVNAGGEVNILVVDHKDMIYLYRGSEIVKPEFISAYSGKPAINISVIPTSKWFGYANDKTCWLSLLINI